VAPAIAGPGLIICLGLSIIQRAIGINNLQIQ
jgi:hypothetical protein